MKVHLLRHTKPDIQEGICYGQTDIDLLSSFDTEKEDVHSLLGSTKYGSIYSSPLKRCARLARFLTPDINKLNFDDRLMELNFGSWEMKPWKEIEKSPEAVKWFDDYLNVPTPGGESYLLLLERVRHFIEDLKENQSKNSVLIVTHLGVLRAFSAIITNTEPREVFGLNVGYGKIYEIEIPPDSTTTREHAPLSRSSDTPVVEPEDAPLLRPIMFVGTGSDVGKSIINTAFCRIFKQDGYHPAPFKAQNMSLNSFATPDGLEIGRAQAVQAEACGIDCEVEMNPVLLKPTGDTESQVVLLGKPVGHQSAVEYFNQTDRDILFNKVMAAYSVLEQKYNPIVIEGAGSISEINLRDRDITNMRVATDKKAAVFLVADIDRGGLFGSVYGTLELLLPDERELIEGIIINKFRGDLSLFESGKKQLELLTGVPVTAIIPWYDSIFIEEEDSVVLKTKSVTASKDKVNVAVVLLQHMSNFTDFLLLERIKTVHLYYASTPDDLKDADVIILPGSKNTIADLNHLRKQGMAAAIIRAHQEGKALFGICGGYQMMGLEIRDPDKVEGNVEIIPGLGILPVRTVLTPAKTTKQVSFNFLDSDENCQGYEIHMGITETDEQGSPLCLIKRDRPDGYFLNQKTWGTYIHGIFDNEVVLSSITGIEFSSEGFNLDLKAFKEQQYDKLADLVRQNTDLNQVYQALKIE